MKLAAVLASALALSAGAANAQVSPEARDRLPGLLDDIFKAHASSSGPGCAVGVSEKGQMVAARAWGMADLEHGVANTPDTVFEAGSVSKQFTAAALLLLERDGKLKMSDDVRRHIPELPNYGTMLTLDHLVSHTGGLRDWGEVAALGGWPRGTRSYTNEEALAIAVRQKALNYRPGEEYSYTNTGYNLAAVVVQRVSGKSLAEFTAERIFRPLGMTRTQWRDRFTRVVKDRAIAYRATPQGPVMDMPFEDTYGHGGLLTTVGDLLIWNRALDEGRLGAGFAERMAEQAVLTGGRRVAYARGVFVDRRFGRREVAHSGATAGYRAWLGRYPEVRVSVAVLCNAADANAVQLGHRVARLAVVAPAEVPAVRRETPTSSEELKVRPGLYLNERTGQVARIVQEGQSLRITGGPVLFAEPEARYLAGADVVVFTPQGFERRSPDGEVAAYRRLQPHAHTPAELAPAAGLYASDEAAATLRLELRDGRLVLTPLDRPSARDVLEPLARDTFRLPNGVLRLVRGAGGRVEALRFTGGRVRDLHFRRAG